MACLPASGLPVACLPAFGLPVACLPASGLPVACLPASGLPVACLPACGCLVRFGAWLRLFDRPVSLLYSFFAPKKTQHLLRFFSR